MVCLLNLFPYKPSTIKPSHSNHSLDYQGHSDHCLILDIIIVHMTDKYYPILTFNYPFCQTQFIFSGLFATINTLNEFFMKIGEAIKKGFSFGLTSSVITTLGLMVGLTSGSHSDLVVIGGILTMATADAFSDSLGIHVSEEAEINISQKQVWRTTIATFVTKFFFTALFAIPVLLFPLQAAIVINVVLGLFLLAIFSYYLGTLEKNISPWKVVAEHLFIALVVIGATYLVGSWVK